MTTIDNRVTLGNVLSIIGTIITTGGLLVTVSVWSGRQDQRIDQMEKAMLDTQTALAGHESRIRQVEQSTARQDERLLLILETVREIKSKLERSDHP